jgi:hypothetical protein
MPDGAHLGIDAERALQTVLGGKPVPAESERAERREIRERITAAAARGGDPRGYGDCADMAAGMVLAFFERKHPNERVGFSNHEALFDEVDKFTDGKLRGLDLTGFMWGWAVNAARFVLEQPPVSNPAIIDLGGSS